MAEAVDELFGLPLEEFTAARNRLAKESGDPSVRSLAKPTVPAWVVNQLARREAALVGRLVESGEAQARALREGGALREAQAEERKAVGELVKRARAILEEAGRSATSPTLDRVAATLTAGAQTPEGREALRAGRLSEEIEPAGFDALAGMSVAPGKRRSEPRDELAEKRRERERKRRKLRDEAQDLEAKAREAEREADRAETAAEKARSAADRARRKADAAAAALADLD